MINVPNSQLLGQICLDSFVYDPIENPMEILQSFFSYQDLQQHLKKLKQWKTLVNTYAYFEINTINNLLYDHKMMCNLLNAAWLLNQSSSTEGCLKHLSGQEQEIFLNRECLMQDSYAKHLSTNEMIDPYLGIKNFYAVFTLQECHQLLYAWLNTALSPNVVIEEEEMVSSFYKSLRKLIECCWLIYLRQQAIYSPKENQAISEASSMATASEEIISPNILTRFKEFLTVVPAERLNRGLRKMLLDYLSYNINGLPVDFEETLSDFYWLTDLLDEIQGKAVDPKFM